MDFLHQLREQNVSRVDRWHGPDTEEWNLADWSNAMQGEAGEAGNEVKKIRRAQTGTGPQTMDDLPELLIKLGKEIADTATYLDLLAHKAGLPTLDILIAMKFNEVSKREGFPERLHP